MPRLITTAQQELLNNLLHTDKITVMKKVLFALFLTGILASCGGDTGNKLEKINAEIAAKKSEISKLKGELSTLQAEADKLKGGNAASGKPVSLVTLAVDTFNHSIDIQGRIDAEESVAVGPQMPGLVKEVRVNAGDVVSAGQVLAVLDDGVYQQGLKEVQVQLDFARTVFDKQKGLWDQKIGSEIQFLQAKNNVESLEKRKATLSEQLDMTRIKAPIAGTVDEVELKIGEMASPGFTTINIVNVSKLRAKAEVAESYIAKVKTGAPVQVYLQDANKTIDATITYSGKIINKLNRTFNVEVAIRSAEADVLPNMIAVLKINDYKNLQAIVCPLSSILKSAEGNSFVYVAEKNDKGQLIAQKRDITFERTYNGQAEILSGLKAGDQLITEGFADLNIGDEVQAK